MGYPEPQDEFHVYMRDWVVSKITFHAIIDGTFFSILYIVSHFIVRIFTRRTDEADRAPLSIFACKVCLTISLAAMLLLPITILSNEIITNFPNYFYTQWLHRKLIFALWNMIFWSANTALVVVLPFSYFFYEADGLGGRGLFARVYEVAAVLALVFVFLVRGLLNEEDKEAYLPFSYSIISSIGALLVLLSIPHGFTTLTTYGMYLRTSRALHPVAQNILSFVITIINLTFTGYLVLRVFIHLLRQFFSPLFGDPTASHLADFLALQDDAKAYHLGSFASLLQILVITYMMTSAFVGFFNLPLTRQIQPQVRGMSVDCLTMAVTCVLLICSSFPVVARILEITSFDLLGHYSNTTYLRSQPFLIGYKFIFLVALTNRYITYFNESLQDFMGNFM